MSTLYLRARGAKWSALIDSWRDFRGRLMEFYDTPNLTAVDAEIARLVALRWEWVEEQREAFKRRKAA